MNTKLFSTHSVRRLDQALLQQRGLSPLALMQEAAANALTVLQQYWPQAKRIVVVAGGGNNGGDACLLAKLAHEAGLRVHLLAIDSHTASPEAAAAKAQAQAAGLRLEALPAVLPAADVVVDGLLGIGFRGPLREGYAAAIAAINASGVPVLALDLPSGLDGDSGLAAHPTVQASVTLSFVAYKRGLFTADGTDYAGQRLLCTLGSEQLDVTGEAVVERISVESIQRAGQGLSPRRANSHKGLFGHALLVGGDKGMGGALLLAAEACLRTGAGLVSCATRAEHLTPLLVRCPSAMVHAVRSGLELAPLIRKASVLAIGPGLGQGSWAELLLQQVFNASQPLVLDADALNLLSLPAWRQNFANRQVVLTPHPAEAARLLGVSVAQVQQDRFAAAQALAQQYQTVVLLKGCGSLVADPSGQLVLCAAGNSGMSSGGMGDCLTGIITGLLAQGLTAWQAACLGLCVHAQAGDKVAQKSGSRGMLAADLAPFIQELFN